MPAPNKGKCCPRHPNQLWVLEVLLPGAKQLTQMGWRVDHSPPLSTMVKNEQSCSSIPPAYLQCVNRDIFIIAHELICEFHYSLSSHKEIPWEYGVNLNKNSRKCNFKTSF
jgi:hypothetical protein